MIANLSQGNKILDIGYADKPNQFLKGEEIVGYDININKSAKNYTKLIEGNVDNIKDQRFGFLFDTVICGEIIEHLKNPYKFLDDIKLLLREEGTLILSTPNPISLNTVIFEYLNSHKWYYTKNHMFYFLPRWMERILSECGYTVMNIVPVGINFFNKPIPSPVSLSYQIIYVAKIKEFLL